MKRHAALQDLSRDHYDALVLVKRIEQAERDTTARQVAENNLKQHWAHLQAHFNEEETLLAPLLDRELRHRMQTDHDRLRQAFARPEADLAETAETLRAHIRWEERTLYPWLQDHLDDDQLARLHERSRQHRLHARGPDSVRPPS